MTMHYVDASREYDRHSLPNIEVFEMTAREVAEMDEDLVHEYMQRREFRLAAMNGSVRSSMLDAIVSEEGLKGGWFYWYCSPGCMPDGPPLGPYATHDEALEAARDGAQSAPK